MTEPSPCSRCRQSTFGTFGALAMCADCRRWTRAAIRAQRRQKEPEYAPGVLRCDHCQAIREEGGENDWFELCRHGAHEAKGTPGYRCNGAMRRVTVAELEALMRKIGGDAA